MARSSWQYLHAPRPPVADPVPHTARRSQAWLTPAEVEQITDRLNDPRFAQDAVAQVFFKTWDEGVYIASLRSWHRVAKTLPPRRPPQRRATRPAAAIPQLHATAPGQVWCWDITKLPTNIRGSSYEFYVAMDIYSRMVVAHRVEKVEDDELARDMFTHAVATHGAPGSLHSDGGPSMTSNVMKEFMTSMGITASATGPGSPTTTPTPKPASRPRSTGPPTPAGSTPTSTPPPGPSSTCPGTTTNTATPASAGTPPPASTTAATHKSPPPDKPSSTPQPTQPATTKHPKPQHYPSKPGSTNPTTRSDSKQVDTLRSSSPRPRFATKQPAIRSRRTTDRRASTRGPVGPGAPAVRRRAGRSRCRRPE